MAYRRSMMTVIAWGLAATLAWGGCGNEHGFDAADLTEGGDAATSSAAPTSGGGAHDVEGGEGEVGTGPLPPPPANGTSDEGGQSSTGGVEDTHFGMSDDMPLVADIPDIKRGLVGAGTWVSLEQVRPSTGRAELDLDVWFYVQDPAAEEHMGLRVTLAPGNAMPDEQSWADLVGYVRHDEQGFRLELETAVEGALHPGVAARRVRIAALSAADADVFDDSLVDVVEPGALVVTRRGPVPGTVLVGQTLGSSGALLVDLRPFGLGATVLPPGTQLSRLRGVAEIGGPRPVILPRSVDDLVVRG